MYNRCTVNLYQFCNKFMYKFVVNLHSIIQLEFCLRSIYDDINVKPARWAKDFIKLRLININNLLKKRGLKCDEDKLIKYYKIHLFRHRRMVKIKHFIYIKAILVVNQFEQSIILKINHYILMFDWTYKLINLLSFCNEFVINL